MSDAPLLAEVHAAYARWVTAVEQRDEAALMRVHHEDFVYTGVDTQRLDRAQHVALELQAEVEQALSDVIAFDLGDVIVASGRHTVHGAIDSELVPASVREEIEQAGLEVAFTSVFVREGDELRVVTHHLQIVGGDGAPAASAAAADGAGAAAATRGASAEDVREMRRFLEGWISSAQAKDRARLEVIHDDRFICTEIHGGRMTREEHMAMEIAATVPEATFKEVLCRRYGDVVIVWGRQTIRGILHLDDALDGATETGTEFVFTAVVRRDGADWRCSAMHASMAAG